MHTEIRFRQRGSLNVRFTPKATELPRERDSRMRCRSAENEPKSTSNRWSFRKLQLEKLEGTVEPRRVLSVILCSLFVSLEADVGTASDNFPTHPITIIVPFPAGGPGDTIARAMSEQMQASLGQPILIENVTGAAGSIGTGRVARATPDGYTLILGYWGTHVANGAVYDLQYDALKNFDPIALLPSQPFVIAARNDMPASDLSHLITWLKANTGKATQGTGGIGSAPHLIGLSFQKMTGTRIRFVPYRGAAPIMRDLLAGHIDMAITASAMAVPQARAGRIKTYAVTAKSRLATAPEIPTVDEAGARGLYFSLWQGVWAPHGTPKKTIAKINKAIVTALSDPRVRLKLALQGMAIPSRDELTPAALGALQRAEIDKWWPIIKAAKLKAR